MSKDSEIKNLQRISEAIEHHSKACEYPATAVYMNPFEVERLDWTEIKGIPIYPDPNLQTGRFRIICDMDEIPGVEVVSEEKTAIYS